MKILKWLGAIAVVLAIMVAVGAAQSGGGFGGGRGGGGFGGFSGGYRSGSDGYNQRTGDWEKLFSPGNSDARIGATRWLPYGDSFVPYFSGGKNAYGRPLQPEGGR